MKAFPPVAESSVTKAAFSAVLFDVDGVLLDSMPQHVEAWVRAGRELGLDIPEDEVYRREGEQATKSARDFIKAAGLMSTRARIRALLEKKQGIYQNIGAAPRIFPGVLEILKGLSENGLRLAFVTGTSRGEMDRILPAELKDFFEASVCGDEVLRGKPNPEPYMKAMGMLKVLPRESLVIENAPYGIQSARSAGATVWAVSNTLPAEQLHEAHRVLGSLEELLA